MNKKIIKELLNQLKRNNATVDKLSNSGFDNGRMLDSINKRINVIIEREKYILEALSVNYKRLENSRKIQKRGKNNQSNMKGNTRSMQ
jgi:hypothetical protein